MIMIIISIIIIVIIIIMFMIIMIVIIANMNISMLRGSRNVLLQVVSGLQQCCLPYIASCFKQHIWNVETAPL